jgi:hypothetical protein
MIRLVGTPLISAILLDADRTDESLGMRFRPDPDLSAEPSDQMLPVP